MASTLKVDTIAHTGGTSALTVDSGGRVKMPNQVIFQGVSETIASGRYTTYTADAPSDGYTLSLTNIGGLLNVGGHFNATTGTFTVPISGIYEFHVGFSSKNNNTNRKIGVVLVNNASIGEAFESSDPYADGNRSFFANLSANDTVQLGTDGEAFAVCSFSGRLIQ
jgi:hypothetical protein